MRRFLLSLASLALLAVPAYAADGPVVQQGTLPYEVYVSNQAHFQWYATRIVESLGKEPRLSADTIMERYERPVWTELTDQKGNVTVVISEGFPRVVPWLNGNTLLGFAEGKRATAFLLHRDSPWMPTVGAIGCYSSVVSYEPDVRTRGHLAYWLDKENHKR